jgi:hypothetical protein
MMDDSSNTFSVPELAESANFNFQWTTLKHKRCNKNPVDSDDKSKKISRDPRLSRLIRDTNATPVETYNKYDVLAVDVPASSNDKPNEKQTRPPPIHLQCEMNFKELQQELIKLVGESGFSCTSTRQGVTIFPASASDYRAINRALRDCGVPHYTYQLPQDKSYRVVIRGLHNTVATDDISKELTDRGFRVRKVTNVISRDKISLPLYFVDLEPSINNNKIYEITTMMNTKIKVEEPRQNRQIVQCKSCQRYGHSKNYCTLPPRCVRCGQSHKSSSCNKLRDEPATCALCNGSHPANYRGCVVHRELQHRRGASPKKITPQQTNNPSPPPDISSETEFPSSLNKRPSDINNTYHKTHGRTYANATTNNGNTFTENTTTTDISSVLSTFLVEMRNLFTPVINLVTQLIQCLMMNHGK